MIDYEDNGFDLENQDLDMEENQDFLDEPFYDEDNQEGLIDPDEVEGEMSFVDMDGDGHTETTIVDYDMDGDGYAETHEVHSDLDNDGIDDYHAIFQEVDTNNSGEMDTMFAEIDSDGDMVPDKAVKYNDYDQDGVYDNVKVYSDTDGDEQLDVVEKHFDSDGDGIIDTTEVYVDETGDGFTDYHVMYDFDEETNLVVLADDYDFDYDDVYYADLEQYDPSTVSDPDMILGDPEESLDYWEYQGEDGPCALYAQMFVIEELSGVDIDIDDFINEATENGWYEDGEGTPILNMNQMLDYYDIDNEMGFNKSMDDIVECLSDGGKVIVSVDAAQIWYGEDTDIFSPMSGANHAVEVIGIDNSDPDNPMVILNDSGHPNGQGEMVPLDVFENAWNEGDRQMIVCYPS
ncbi:MAG: hypothetical protein IKW83_11280 [Muribaculaceae bacterium]|nr:hypothetical protein [Muribaculaceae bacterium]